MIRCPTCRAPLVQVNSMPDAAGQFICGCVGTTWVYRTSGDLEHIEVVAGASSPERDD